jgi:hypothetical protein
VLGVLANKELSSEHSSEDSRIGEAKAKAFIPCYLKQKV